MTNKERVYQFQSDWFSQNIPLWEGVLEHLKGQVGLKVLEIGSFEGRSTVWILENVATDPSASVTCIDTFAGSMEDAKLEIDSSEIERTFRYNIDETGVPEKVEVLKGQSRSKLRGLVEDTYDFIYVDGSHVAMDVLTDATMAFFLLKEGGIMIFDDYHWDEESNPLHRPKRAIDAFLDIFQERITVLHKADQVIVKRNKDNTGRVDIDPHSSQ